jgi:single-stranded-DNA-specific exonuclease
MQFLTRPFAETDRAALVRSGMHPVLARIYAARRIKSVTELETDPARLLAPSLLAHAEKAARLLADTIALGKHILIVADYDCDGATACAVGLRALRSFGANVGYLVPNRFELGYGLTPELVDLAAKSSPDLIVTVDNGIASVEGVAHARSLGIATLITDHHLPGAELPAAECIVNPNQPACAFPSKSLAGVGVMFYVMLALRAELRDRGVFKGAHFPDGEPNLSSLTDLVALGTVADVVALDANNRILVGHGLKRLRSGKGKAGLNALMQIAGRDPHKATAFDFGFIMGPRLNAAGRLSDMSLGIECLITDDPARAANCARELDALNSQRRTIEGGMLEEALGAVTELPETPGAGVALFHAAWHQGVVGILASRIKDKLHRPVIAFARATEGGITGMLRGSGRSITGLHLRDCLDVVSKRDPGLIVRFGGHAQAAGLTIRESDLERFTSAFEAAAEGMIPAAALKRTVETDGELETAYLTLEVAQMMENQIWGQGFPQPVFCDTFDVESQRIVAGKHTKLRLCKDGRRIEAIWFNSAGTPTAAAHQNRIRAAYRLSVNEYNGLKSVQVNVEHAEPITS